MDFSTLKGLTIPEGIVTKITNASGAVLWALKTSRLPDEYQEVEWVGISNAMPYLDLGFSFDTKARIYIKQIVYSAAAGYLFGAAENSGALRCMLTSPSGGSGEVSAYGSNGSSYLVNAMSLAYSSEGVPNDLELTLEEGYMCFRNLSNGEIRSQTAQASYTMTNNLYLFAQNYNGTMRQGSIVNLCVGAFEYYDKNDELICDLIPCYRKSDGEIGMYDVARKTFLTNVGTGTFKKGADVVDTGGIITNWKNYSINADGSIYNDGLGYKVGYRVRSVGTETAVDTGICTGYIPLKIGDTLRIYPPFTSKNTTNAINFVNGSFENIGQVTDYGSRYGICTSINYMPTIIDGASMFTLTEEHDTSIAYVRVNHDSEDTSGVANLIITVNEIKR